jgi:predicted DNA-binding transcriptional regulator AlpA
MTGKELVDYKGLKALGIRYSKVHVGRLEETATFPRSFKLADHRNSPRVWKLSEVFEWIDARAATRPPKL